MSELKCWSCGKDVSFYDRRECDGNCPHCNQEIDLEAVIADLNKRVSPWVSVDDRLPEYGRWYLITTTHQGFNERISTMAFLDSCGDEVIWLSHNDKEDDFSEWENVTHWMPLPEAPEV